MVSQCYSHHNLDPVWTLIPRPTLGAPGRPKAQGAPRQPEAGRPGRPLRQFLFLFPRARARSIAECGRAAGSTEPGLAIARATVWPRPLSAQGRPRHSEPCSGRENCPCRHIRFGLIFARKSAKEIQRGNFLF